MLKIISHQTYLCTEMEVTKKYCSFTACDDENKKHQKQKSKHVIHLVRPASEKQTILLQSSQNKYGITAIFIADQQTDNVLSYAVQDCIPQ